MAIPQPGIFAQGTRSHHHLELDIHPASSTDAVLGALRALREPPEILGGANTVIGFGADLAQRLLGAEAPAQLAPFRTIEGLDQTRAPATQHDLWIWVHGSGPDVVLDAARAAAAAFAPVADLAAEQPCFVYRDSRDMTGFVDGTANPGPDEAPEVALVANGEVGAGGAFVLAQRWVHDLASFTKLTVDEQERVFGRTKPDSIELGPERMPSDAHVPRMEVEVDGEELEIFRRSVAFGDVGTQGLFFLAFSADPARFDVMLSRMFGEADGIRDRLTDFTRPTSGAYYFAPSLDALNGLLA